MDSVKAGAVTFPFAAIGFSDSNSLKGRPLFQYIHAFIGNGDLAPALTPQCVSLKMSWDIINNKLPILWIQSLVIKYSLKGA